MAPLENAPNSKIVWLGDTLLYRTRLVIEDLPPTGNRLEVGDTCEPTVLSQRDKDKLALFVQGVIPDLGGLGTVSVYLDVDQVMQLQEAIRSWLNSPIGELYDIQNPPDTEAH